MCPTCKEYLDRRIHALHPHVKREAKRRRWTVAEVLSVYMLRVHLRHLAGGSLEVG